MKKAPMNIECKVGDLVAWESQAAGSWRTKIGRIVSIPHPNADQRTSASKVRIKVLASYPVSTEKDIGKAKGVIRAKTTQAEGRASIKQMRTPSAAERKAILL